MIVVADSSPLQYLIQIECDHLLPRLFESIILPEGVMQELSHPHAPSAVRAWLRELPLWIRQDKAITHIPADLSYLGLGEREAIQIASTEPHIDLILLDDRQARAEARRRGLKITGTLGVLLDAADRGPSILIAPTSGLSPRQLPDLAHVGSAVPVATDLIPAHKGNQTQHRQHKRNRRS